MLEMFRTLKEVASKDPKDFWEGVLAMTLIVIFTWFMFWFFIPNFAYDM